VVVVVSIDGMRADYLDRFGPQLEGGLRRLLDEGAVFADALHDHANTETAVGHATLLSGRHPAHTGIVANNYFDPSMHERRGFEEDRAERQLNGGRGASPRLLIGSNLVDWLLREYPEGQVVALSGKARVSILMGGHQARNVFWYSVESGLFTTSTYYSDALPGWVELFNQRRNARSFAGARWELLLGDEAAYSASREDDFPGEVDHWALGRTFPHPLPGQDPELSRALRDTPFVDELTVELAEEAVRALDLGGDEAPDLLLVGLSATDYIGHDFGPFSREVQDQILRLDRLVGRLLATLEERVGHDRLLVALVADHGMTPIPAQSVRDGQAARWVPIEPALAALGKELDAELGTQGAVLGFENGVLYLDHQVIREAGADPEQMAAQAAAALRSLDCAERVATRREIESWQSAVDPIARALRNAHHPERGGDVYVVLAEGCQLFWNRFHEKDRAIATSHGTPRPSDTHVPLILWGSGILPGRYPQRVSTVDLAPTLAALLGVEPTEPLDGRVLDEAIDRVPVGHDGTSSPRRMKTGTEGARPIFEAGMTK